MSDLVEHAKKMFDTLTKIDKSVSTMSEIAKEIEILLLTAVFKGSENELPIGKIEVSVEVDRPLRKPSIAPLRCEETEDRLRKISIVCTSRDYSCEIVLTLSIPTTHTREYSMRDISLSELLTLACNTTPEEMDKLVSGMDAKVATIAEDLSKLKELLTYARLTT